MLLGTGIVDLFWIGSHNKTGTRAADRTCTESPRCFRTAQKRAMDHCNVLGRNTTKPRWCVSPSNAHATQRHTEVPSYCLCGHLEGCVTRRKTRAYGVTCQSSHELVHMPHCRLYNFLLYPALTTLPHASSPIYPLQMFRHFPPRFNPGDRSLWDVNSSNTVCTGPMHTITGRQ